MNKISVLNMSLAIIMVLLTFHTSQVRSLDAILSVSPATVNSNSTLQINITFGESTGKGGVISLAVPEQDMSAFPLSSLNMPLSFQQKSQIVSCKSNSLIYTVVDCQTPNSKQLNIFMTPTSFILAGQSLVITIVNGTQNPSSLWYTYKSLQITTYNSLAQKIEHKSQLLTLASLKPGLISNPLLLYGSQTIGLSSQTFQVVFKNANSIPQSGRIDIQFPQRSASNFSAGQYINVNNYTVLEYSVNGIQQTKILNLTMQGGYQVLQLQVNQNVYANSIISIKISEFNNPLQFVSSVSNLHYFIYLINFIVIQDGLIIRTFDNLQCQVDQSSTLPLSVSAPAFINNLQVSLQSGSTAINKNSVIEFGFQAPFSLSPGCVIQIKVPIAYSQNLYTNLQFINAYGFSGQTQSLNFTVQDGVTSQGQKVVIIFGACSGQLQTDQMAKIQLKYLQNPDSLRDTEAFTVQIFDNQVQMNLLIDTPLNAPSDQSA